MADITLRLGPEDQLDLAGTYAYRDQQRLYREHEAMTAEKPSAIETGAKAMQDAQKEGGKSIADGLMELVTGTQVGGKTTDPIQSAKKILDGLVGLGMSPFTGLAAGAGQAVENAYPDVANAPAISGTGAMGIRGLLSGKAVANMTPEERTAISQPMSVREVIETAIQLGAPIMMPRAFKKAKELPQAHQQALGAAKQAMGAPLAAVAPPGEVPPGRINLGRVDASGEVKQTLLKMNRMNAEKLAKSRETVTHGQTVAKAKGITLDEVMRLDPNKYDVAALETAVRDHLNTAATLADALAEKAAAGDASAAAQFQAAFSVGVDLAGKNEVLARNIARGLEALKIDSEAARVLEMLRTQDASDPVLLANAWLSLKSIEQKRTFWKQVAAGYRVGKNIVHEAWINALLSGPQTHAANALSNAAVSAWAIPERFLAATLDVGAFPGGQGRSVFYGEAPAMLRGMVEGWKEGLKLVKDSWDAKQVPTFGPDKVEIPPSLTAEALGLSESSLAWGIDALGAMVRVPGSALKMSDAVFKLVNYRMELHAQAYRLAASKGLSGPAFAIEYRKLLTEEGIPAKTAADHFALQQTFNLEFGELGFIGQAARGLSMAADAVPMGRVVMPFVRTPANLMHWSFERAPLLQFASDTWRADIAAGGARRATALAKTSAGLMTAALVASYAFTPVNDGEPVPFMTVFTGHGPTDPKFRANLERLGWKPYAVYDFVNREYVQLSRLGGMFDILGSLANFTEIAGQVPEMGATESGIALVLAMNEHFKDKTFLRGIADLFEAMTDVRGGGIQRYATRLSDNPVALMRQVTSTWDPIRREADGIVDRWRKTIPGYSSDLPPVRNLWGEPVTLTGGWGWDLVSPIASAPVSTDPVDLEIARLRIPISPTPKAVEGRLPSPIQMQMDPAGARLGIKLTPQERDRLAILTAKPEGDEPLKEHLRTLLGTETYQQASDEVKVDEIRRAVKLYRQRAEALLLDESPRLKEATEELLRRRENDRKPADQRDPSLGSARDLSNTLAR